MRRDVFQATADPNRRAIIQVIAGHSLPLNAVAGSFSIGRQAVLKHISILAECGLLTISEKGRERFCEAGLDQLNEISVWITPYRKFYE